LTPRAVARDLAGVAVAACLSLAVIAGYATYRIIVQGQQDDRRPADAIVVMGAAQYDGRPSPVFAARLDHAIGLFQAGIAPRLIVTGGKAAGDRTTEAASARAYAVQRGIPPEAILMEDGSRTTAESVRAVADIMSARGLSSAVFVSDRPHILRVLRMATDDGIAAWGSPTRTSPIESDLSARLDATVHELGALGQYFLAGRAR
jgi:uncharacterized SAM-binding protein YcdF (DUF218 family)